MRFTFPAPKPPTAHAGRINHRKDSLLIALFLIDTNQPHGQVPSSESRTRPSRHPPGGNDTQETRPRSREARAPEKRLLSFRRRSLPEPILTALPLHTRGAGGSAPRRPLAERRLLAVLPGLPPRGPLAAAAMGTLGSAGRRVRAACPELAGLVSVLLPQPSPEHCARVSRLCACMCVWGKGDEEEG